MQIDFPMYRTSFMLVFGTLALLFVLTNSAEDQFFRNLLKDSTQSSDWNLRDDRPTEESTEELSFEEIICTNREFFPKMIYESFFSSHADCKIDLDRIQEASYVDLTYRIRWDEDRLDLYLPGAREIFICDGAKITKYEHDKRKDPDWWMIIRNSPEAVSCLSDEIFVETIE